MVKKYRAGLDPGVGLDHTALHHTALGEVDGPAVIGQRGVSQQGASFKESALTDENAAAKGSGGTIRYTAIPKRPTSRAIDPSAYIGVAVADDQSVHRRVGQEPETPIASPAVDPRRPRAGPLGQRHLLTHDDARGRMKDAPLDQHFVLIAGGIDRVLDVPGGVVYGEIRPDVLSLYVHVMHRRPLARADIRDIVHDPWVSIQVRGGGHPVQIRPSIDARGDGGQAVVPDRGVDQLGISVDVAVAVGNRQRGQATMNKVRLPGPVIPPVGPPGRARRIMVNDRISRPPTA